MSKKDDMKNSLNSLVGGFIAPMQPISEDTKKESIKQEDTKKDEKVENKSSKKITVSEDIKKTYDAKSGNYNKTNNYTITFKIDADIDDYLKNIDKITFIESIKSGKIESTTKTEFVNNLIREQYYKLIGASKKDDADTINKKWLDYKSKNNL